MSKSKRLPLIFFCCAVLSFQFYLIAAQDDDTVDLTALPLGDGRISDEAEIGAVWACESAWGTIGAHALGDWIDTASGTFDLTAKAVVDGEVTWTSDLTISTEGDTRIVSGNGLPQHETGTYPIEPSDDAYQFDRNPNPVQAQQLSYELPVFPVIADQPSCLNNGAIGILLTGSVLFNALDARGLDAVAHETQDACMGHPEVTGLYHYHSLTPCVEETEHELEHSRLFGYALDGFGIYGHHGENGELLFTDDLDACHGHIHAIEWEGEMVKMYHYHATYDYPYVIGCYRGTPIPLQRQQPPPPPPPPGRNQP